MLFRVDKMLCSKCNKPAIINLQHGALCKSDFINYFENKVFKTIKKFKLFSRNDTFCIATSGGKDSLTVLYLTKKYLEKFNYKNKLFALVIDEGIKNYRKNTIIDLRKFCQKHNIELKEISSKEVFGYTLDEAYPKHKSKKPCNICGVWRRYLLNKYARKFNATKVITGHNLDDEAQAILMNMFKANTKLAGHLGPISGIQEHNLFVQRIKPLYLCSEKETRLYTLLKGFQVNFTECPYSSIGYRAHIRDMLNDFENQYKGTKNGIVQSFLAILPNLKTNSNKESIKTCKICSEPANNNICNACKILEDLKNV